MKLVFGSLACGVICEARLKLEGERRRGRGGTIIDVCIFFFLPNFGFKPFTKKTRPGFPE